MTSHGYRLSYLQVGEIPAGVDEGVLYCDPLTSLVAYPSFEEYVIKMLPLLLSDRLNIAIGDVDGLRDYVSQRRAADPGTFGHLAGNACMRTVGALTNSWAMTELSDVAFHVCGTFGGDEVIVAASGLRHDLFAEKIHRLCQTIKVSSPRPCSFALATLQGPTVTQEWAEDVYRSLVSMVDARLFHIKEQARLDGGHLEGSVSDLGVLSLLDQDATEYPVMIGGGW